MNADTKPQICVHLQLIFRKLQKFQNYAIDSPEKRIPVTEEIKAFKLRIADPEKRFAAAQA